MSAFTKSDYLFIIPSPYTLSMCPFVYFLDHNMKLYKRQSQLLSGLTTGDQSFRAEPIRAMLSSGVVEYMNGTGKIFKIQMIKWNTFKNKLSPFQIILLAFAGVIILGGILLMLPVSAKSGDITSPECAFFTATSAVCVTGLIIRDTASYWSPFGQAVILLLIQAGGLGVITVALFIETLRGKKLSLLERDLVEDSISAFQIGGIAEMMRFIFRVALIIEAGGALLMMPVFCTDFGLSGIWMAVFHSISAFCNAGFDLMGTHSGAFSSLTAYNNNVLIVLPISFLIIFGGLGFLTWEDIVTRKRNLKRYRMQSKVILATTAVLIVIPAVLYFFAEFTGTPLMERVSLSLFQSVTPRTAGFNTADLTKMSGAGIGLMIVLMLIGGSPGSTAGGMKNTTLAVFAANALSVFRKKKETQMFGKRVENSTVLSASALVLLYLFLTLSAAMLISRVEGLPMKQCLFETASAVGTVGLTLGITPSLGLFSHIILMLLMFFGRVGGLTLMYAAISGNKPEVSRCPVEKINVG